jgi:hypothetical protein
MASEQCWDVCVLTLLEAGALTAHHASSPLVLEGEKDCTQNGGQAKTYILALYNVVGLYADFQTLSTLFLWNYATIRK